MGAPLVTPDGKAFTGSMSGDAPARSASSSRSSSVALQPAGLMPRARSAVRSSLSVSCDNILAVAAAAYTLGASPVAAGRSSPASTLTEASSRALAWLRGRTGAASSAPPLPDRRAFMCSPDWGAGTSNAASP